MANSNDVRRALAGDKNLSGADLKRADLSEANLSKADLFAANLFIPRHSEVDLLIRTSGENRISNFMLWQISYAEIIVTPTLWPDFNRSSLNDVIVEYQARDRRFGGRP